VSKCREMSLPRHLPTLLLFPQSPSRAIESATMNEPATQNNVDTLLADIRQGWDQIRTLPTEFDNLRTEMRETRRLAATTARSAARPKGGLSDEAALALAGHFILHCERCGRMEALAESTADRDKLLGIARSALGISTRAALTINEVALPS